MPRSNYWQKVGNEEGRKIDILLLQLIFFREQSPKEFNSSWDSVAQVFYDAYEQKYIISIKIVAHISEKEFSML